MRPRSPPRPLPALVNELLQRWRLCLASLLIFTVFITNNLGLTSAVSSGGWPQVSHHPLVLSTAPTPWWHASYWSIAHPFRSADTHGFRHRQYSKRDTHSAQSSSSSDPNDASNASAAASAASAVKSNASGASTSAPSNASAAASDVSSAQISSSVFPVPCNTSLPPCHIDATTSAACDEHLPCANRSLATEVCALDATARVRSALLHPSVPSLCWSGECPPPILNQTQVDHIIGDDVALCERAVYQLLCKIYVVNVKVANFNSIDNSTNDISTKYNCREHNSLLECECKEWYLTWLCYSSWPVYYVDGGVWQRVPPCLSVCRAVQEYCPFHLLPDESSASGDPSYLCEAEDQFIAGSRPPGSGCCYEPLSLNSSRPGDEPVSSPLEGAWVNLNATCASLSPSSPSPSCDTAPAPPVLANRTLTLRLRAPSLPQLNWFWNMVSSTGARIAPSRWKGGAHVLLCVLMQARRV